MKEPTTESSGNVFIDLGFAEAEAAVLQMRADLMIDLQQFIKGSYLTQAQVAKKLGITQTRVSDLVRGKWQKFNLETLIALAQRTGKKVSLNILTPNTKTIKTMRQARKGKLASFNNVDGLMAHLGGKSSS